jgi:hypothetical protein
MAIASGLHGLPVQRTFARAPNSISRCGAQVSILRGMVATVDIRTGKKTVLHYFLKPIIKNKETALREL